VALKHPVVVLAAVSFLAAVPVLAHHSFAAEFDINQPVTLKGVITKVEWFNPHVYIYVDVQDANGKTVNWSVEGGPPNTLYRQGWRKDSLKPGDVVTIDAYRAKDGSTTADIPPDRWSQSIHRSVGDGSPKAAPTK
jgi:hypothetical protein